MSIVLWLLSVLIWVGLLYGLGMVIFVGVSMLTAVVQTREIYDDPKETRYPRRGYPGGFFAAFKHEIWTMIWVVAGSAVGQLFYRDREGNRDKTNTQPPVLFLHGWTETGWHWRWMIRRLRFDRSRRLYTLTFRPIDAPAEHYRRQLEDRIDAILSATGHEKLTLIGHSFGGLVSRAYLRHNGTAKVERLITLGTPHGGSVWAYLFSTPVTRHLRPHGEFLTELTREEKLDGVELVSIATIHDNMVIPFTRALHPHSRHILLHEVGHVGLMVSPQVLAVIRSILFGTPAPSGRDMERS